VRLANVPAIHAEDVKQATAAALHDRMGHSARVAAIGVRPRHFGNPARAADEDGDTARGGPPSL
jgi:hypothetical protein